MGQCAVHEQGGSLRLPAYPAPSTARSTAGRARYCSRWTTTGYRLAGHALELDAAALPHCGERSVASGDGQ